MQHCFMLGGKNDFDRIAIEFILTFLHFNTQNKDLFLHCIQDLTTDNCFHGNGVTVSFTEDQDAIATVDNFPVITNPIPECYSTVKFSQYKELLKTKHLGHVMIYTDVITSTQTIVNG